MPRQILTLAAIALLLGALCALGAGSVQAAPYVFKYANTQSESHPRSQSMVFFKNTLEKASGGRIQVELYFAGVLGKEAEVLEMVQLGTVQGCRGGLFERANKKYLIGLWRKKRTIFQRLSEKL